MSPAATLSPTTRFLPLFTWDGRCRPVGKTHLAKVKSTKKPAALAWCGRTFFVDPDAKRITGETALLLLYADPADRDGWQPTCQACLDRAGAWGWCE